MDDFKEDFSQEKQLELFFVVNLLFSVLIDMDKKDAARLDTAYFDGNLNEPIHDVFIYLEECRNKDNDKFNANIPLNKLRNQFLDEIKANQNIVASNHFYTITAPTGIGKTFGCFAFANQLKEKLPTGEGRIIYCLPYTSVIDQNFDEFENIIKFTKKELYHERPSRYLLKHHHLEFKKIINRIDKEQYSYKDYIDDRLFVESWQSSMIVTTFVQFFHTIIGYKNRFLKKFHNVVNSIVILDEVQNINPEYYPLLREIFDVLGKQFNIYFLLITATQPEILDSKKSVIIELVNSEQYMLNSVFNRVRLKIEKEAQSVNDFTQRFCGAFKSQNCLIVVNTKKTAIDIFRHIKEEKTDYQVFCLTTYLTPYDRRKKLNLIKEALKNNAKIIVIATQLVEAGVDLSFNYVYRDFGPLDSIIQVAGRCNRNGEYGELGGEMVIILLKDDNDPPSPYHSYIYKPILAQYVNETLNCTTYESKDFIKLSKNYFNKFDFIKKSNKLLEAIYDLNYNKEINNQTPIKDFKLIDEYDEDVIYILTTNESQQAMDRLVGCRKALENKEMFVNRKNEILIEIETIKGQLKDFQISLRKNELNRYTEMIKGESHYLYFAYDQINSVYCEDIGFLSE